MKKIEILINKLPGKQVSDCFSSQFQEEISKSNPISQTGIFSSTVKNAQMLH